MSLIIKTLDVRISAVSIFDGSGRKARATKEIHRSRRLAVNRTTHRSGMALMLVIPAVALSAVLAYAVLSNTGMQQQISGNAASIAQADCLAESGVNYAMYNLQNPSNAPPFTGNFWAGPSGPIAMGGGTFNCSVTQSGSTYIISSTGSSSGTRGTTTSRSIKAAVTMTLLAVAPNQAVGINGPVSLLSGMTVSGDLHTTGAVTLNAGATVSGDIFASSLTLGSGSINPLGFIQQTLSTIVAAPTTVTDYRTYTLNGVTYSGTLLTTDPVAGTTLGPTASNPAGVYYAQGRNVNLNGVTINGTLIVKKSGSVGGSVNVTGSSANTVNPISNFPALVVDSQIIVIGSNKRLAVNGLAWAGAGLARSGTVTGSNITVNGSLLIPSSTGLGTYNAGLTLNYNANNVTVPNFSSQTQVPKNITLVSWSE